VKGQKSLEYSQPLILIKGPNPKRGGIEVFLSISHCGICHSDLHVQDGFLSLAGTRKLDVSGGRDLP